jgi:copper homeostasis protein
VDRVLTSGGKSSVPEGLAMLKQLITHAGNRLTILPGGGISAENFHQMITQLGVKEIHLSGKTFVQSPMIHSSSSISLCSSGEVYDFQWYECDAANIKAVRDIIFET